MDGRRQFAVGFGLAGLARAARLLLDRKRDRECRAVLGPALSGDRAVVPLDDLAAERQTDARTRIGGAAVQPLECPEDPRAVLRIEADPVVAHGQLDVTVDDLGAD